MGLFTGMSILSMFEIVFWLLRIFLTKGETKVASEGNKPARANTARKSARKKGGRKLLCKKKHNIIGTRRLLQK